MGIKDLLKFMKPYVEPIHIKKYAGKRVGIDAYSWLHKGAYSCSMELHLNMEGDKKKQYLSYCMHRINLLRHHNITPVVVFDGGNLPCKAATEEERHRKRKANRDLAMVKLKEGNVSAASELFQRAVSITPSMAHQLIQILRSENIEFVVAPYEADAQLAYLSHLKAEKGGIVAVISEDSDLLAYGCPSVVFKMDRFGNGEEIVLDKVFDSMARVPSFRNFDKELFIGMCVLAGCDFLPSVPGIGIGKAYSFVSKYRNIDRVQNLNTELGRNTFQLPSFGGDLTKVLSVLKFEKGNQMPEDYLKCFKEAVAVFQHARIYDTFSKKLKHIKPLPHALLQCLDEEIDFLGPEIPPSMAIAIAEGNLDPCTMEAFNCFPGTGSHLNPTIISQTHDRFPREEATALSTQQSCFTIVSSSKTRRERSPVIEQELISEERKQKPVLEKRKYLNEAITLEKLVFPLKSEASEAIKTVPCKNTLTVPDNNPFKKRKFNEVQLDLTESTTKQVSAVTKVESLEIFCVTPESQQCMTESITEQVSVVTEVESLEMFCVTPESQQSVDSKSIKMFDGKRRIKSENKLKRSNSNNSDNKKSSILNFFSRV